MPRGKCPDDDKGGTYIPSTDDDDDDAAAAAAAAERKQERLEACMAEASTTAREGGMWRVDDDNDSKCSVWRISNSLDNSIVSLPSDARDREASSSSPLPLSTGMVEKPKVKIGLGLAKIKGKKRRRKKNSIAATRLPGAAFLVLGESRTTRNSM